MDYSFCFLISNVFIALLFFFVFRYVLFLYLFLSGIYFTYQPYLHLYL